MAETKKARKKRDTSLKRNAILEGAIKVFTKNGFDISFRHILAFWDNKFSNGLPVNEFEIYFSYQLNGGYGF